MKFNEVKYNILYLSCTNHKHQYGVGVEWTENSPEEKDQGILVDKKLDISRQCALADHKAQYPGLYHKFDQQVEGCDSPLLFHAHKTPPGSPGIQIIQSIQIWGSQ